MSLYGYEKIQGPDASVRLDSILGRTGIPLMQLLRTRPGFIRDQREKISFVASLEALKLASNWKDLQYDLMAA